VASKENAASIVDEDAELGEGEGQAASEDSSGADSVDQTGPPPASNSPASDYDSGPEDVSLSCASDSGIQK
jgi:hypothetical protein